MTPNINNPREIYFDIEDIFSKISEILEKNGLEETPLNAALKKEEPFIQIILRLTRNFIVKNISEKDFLASLQKQLGVTTATAQNIIKDLEERIIPFATKLTISKGGGIIKTPIQPEQQQQEIPQKKSFPAKENVLPKKKTIPPLEKTDITVKKNIVASNKKDVYREPIE